jgi:hypothetical protein
MDNGKTKERQIKRSKKEVKRKLRGRIREDKLKKEERMN